MSDASVNNLAKLRKLSKVFLWQTKFTEKGAESLKKSFVDMEKYNSLKNQQAKFRTSLEQVKKSEEGKLTKLEASKDKIGKQTVDEKAINAKCPVTNKDLDESKISTFEGRKIGFCCDKCKGKFDANPASFKSKIKDFKPSDAFAKAESDLNKAKQESAVKTGEMQGKLGKLSGELKKLGPEVNLGWKEPVAKKK